MEAFGGAKKTEIECIKKTRKSANEILKWAKRGKEKLLEVKSYKAMTSLQRL